MFPLCAYWCHLQANQPTNQHHKTTHQRHHLLIISFYLPRHSIISYPSVKSLLPIAPPPPPIPLSHFPHPHRRLPLPTSFCPPPPPVAPLPFALSQSPNLLNPITYIVTGITTSTHQVLRTLLWYNLQHTKGTPLRLCSQNT